MSKTEISEPRKFDLEDRTFNFAKKTLVFANALPKLLSNSEVGGQFIWNEKDS